jgi:hypothetical protein
MARYFAPISEQDLEKKVFAAFGEDTCMQFHEIKDELGKDLKVEFDGENFETYDGKSELMGVHTLDNDLTFWGMSAGGDWEYPVFFLIYWDGKKLRGYVPTDGNPWNTATKQAFGNDGAADFANAKKRWPDKYKDVNFDPEDDDFEGHFESDDALMKQDILARILPQPTKKPKTPVTKYTTLQERIEALTFYGTGDEAYELFDQACNFCYHLYGLGYEEEAKIVCGWAEKMAEASKDWAENDADTLKGRWG